MDPLERYKALVSTLVAQAPQAAPPLVDPDALAAQAEQEPTTAAAAHVVATHVAQRSGLTGADARAIFENETERQLTAAGPTAEGPDTLKKAHRAAAHTVADVANATPAHGVSATLSDPVMLDDGTRRRFAAGCAVGVLLAVVFLFVLGLRKATPSWAFASLSFALFFLVVAMLVLVMGYKNVQMSGSVGVPGDTAPAPQPKRGPRRNPRHPASRRQGA
jgi:hypothetical protein